MVQSSAALASLEITQKNAAAAAADSCALRACVHCGNAVPRARLETASAAAAFCCPGCETVHGILVAAGLDRYYDLRNGAGVLSEKPVTASDDSFAYLDDPAFRAEYAPAQAMRFYLEGVHCVACLWLVEKLPQLVPGVLNSELDLGRAIATVKIGENANFAAAARMLDRLGYRPHPVREGGNEALRLEKLENRRWLVRIGVAGASAGNIMLMAVPLYGGADGFLATVFRWLSLVLFLPAATYSALPFYRSAWSALRSRTLSIDVPVAGAIIAAGLVSFYNLMIGSEHLYFDSLAALIFLLLASRYALRRIQQTALSASGLASFVAPSRARRRAADGSVADVATSSLVAGDRIEVRTGERLPADGVLRLGSTLINCALLTGESAPALCRPGDEVFAGTVNEGETIELEVTAAAAQTRVGRLLAEIESGAVSRAPIVAAADRVSKWFVLGVLALAIGVFVFSGSAAEGLNRALALVIVTCPCALALATPLTMTLALRLAARRGILVKSAEAIEKLEKVRTIYLDKTGTLTHGSFELLDWKTAPAADAAELARAVVALELKSHHPIAKALVKGLGAKPLAEVTDFSEELGTGVRGTIAGQRYEVRGLTAAEHAQRTSAQNAAAGGTRVVVLRNSLPLAWATLGDALREDSERAVARLRAAGFEPRLLSGDNADVVRLVADQVGIPLAHCHAFATPELKRKVVSQAGTASLMVGDGANDAVALASATVGAAVHGSMEVSLRAADIYLARPGVAPIVELLQLSRQAMRVIRRNFALSIAYNVFGATASLLGYVTPLFAAVLMPISALTVFGSTLLLERNSIEEDRA